ncbi:MAG: hypothetical protein FJ217_06795 [Ignavibacteria bacterium]|nr:hypothetical protein [Ignavibacteria bacterium]
MHKPRSGHVLQEVLGFADETPSRKEASHRQRLKRLLSGKLDFHGEYSNYAVHSWHSFPAKFPPQLPRLLIRELTEPGEIVFDPMMGSCTTLTEAMLLNRRALGSDIDPLALEIAKAKLKTINASDVWATGRRILASAQKACDRNADGLAKEFERRFNENTRTFIDYWFRKKTQLELISLVREIECLLDPCLRDFFKLVFSSIIITKSGGVSLARDLAHTRPHKVEKKPTSVFVEFWRRLQRVLRDYYPAASVKDPSIFEADARNLPLRDNSVDLIVTSPPYASHAIDYMRAHKFSLVWFGYPVEHLSALRKKYIGGDSIGDVRLLPMPKHSGQVVRSLSHLDSKKGLVLHRYYSEMMQILLEMFRVIKRGRAVVVVVGSSRMRGIDVQTDKCLSEIGEEVGFHLVHVAERRMDRDRRMMPARWHGNGGNNIELRMHKEFVLGFLKPASEP